MNWMVGLSIVSWLAIWLLVVFSWGLKEIDEAQAPTNAQFDSDDTLAGSSEDHRSVHNANWDAVQAARPT
jgi:hypothetical protein